METETTGRKGKIFIFVIALCGALLLWIYAIGYDTELSDRTYSGISVELAGINSNGYTVAEGDHFSLNIDLQASGTRSVLDRVSVSDFHAYVDISSVNGPGYHTLPISVIAPNGLSIETLSVQNVTLYIDTFTSKNIPVFAEQTYSSLYEIGKVEQSMYTVSVYGPESVISSAEAYCSFSLGNVTEDTVHVSGEVALRDSDTKAAITNPYITIGNSTLQVTYHMYDRKTVPWELVLTGGTFLPSDVQFVTTVPGVTLYGPVEKLAELQSLAISCDETAATDGRLSGTVQISELLAANGLDAEITAEGLEQMDYVLLLPTVRYRTVRVPVSRITVYGLPFDGSVRAVASGTLEVTVFGMSDAVRAYQADKMTIRVDYGALEHDITTDEYVGVAEIDTGDSSVCVDGKTYYVTVRVTGT